MQNREFIVNTRTIQQAIDNDEQIKSMYNDKRTILERMSAPSILISRTEITPVIDRLTQKRLDKIDEMIMFRRGQIENHFRI